MNSKAEIMNMLERSKQIIDKVYELIKEENDLETSKTSSTACGIWNTREQMIFGENYNPENYGNHGSCSKHFEDMSLETAEALIHAGFLDPYETENDSPSVREFIQFVKDHPDGNFTFHGYAIGPDRKDCRVSFEGIDSNTMMVNKQTIIDFVDMFIKQYPADEFEVEGSRLYCWYD